MILGLILLNIFIKNLDEKLEGICAKFADDARLEGRVECEKEKPLYGYLDKLKG